MSARQEIADALTATGLVRVTPHYRQGLRSGDGFVKWNGRQRGSGGLGWVDTWQVWLALPQDVLTAEEWLAEHLDTLVAAADTEVIVTDSTPADLVLGDSTTNGLIISGARAA